MNTRKLCGTVAAAIFTFALSATASASCQDDADLIAGDVMQLQTDLACPEYPDSVDGITGEYEGLTPIWQYRPKRNGDGCEVHYKLSKLLFEKSQPKKGKGKANNGDYRGAYAALLDGQYQYAHDLLVQFNLSAMDATLTPDDKFVPGPYGDGTAEGTRKFFLDRGYVIQVQVAALAMNCQ